MSRVYRLIPSSLSITLLHEYTTVGLSAHLMIDVWVVSNLGLLGLKQLRTFMVKSFLMDIYFHLSSVSSKEAERLNNGVGVLNLILKIPVFQSGGPILLSHKKDLRAPNVSQS